MSDTISLEAKKAIIQKQKIFSQLTDEENTELASLLKETPFIAGDTIVTEGDKVDSIFFIVSGRADVRHISVVDGKSKIQSLALLGPNQAIGLNETGFYSLTGKRTATVVAISEMMTLYLSMPRFHGFTLAHSHVSELMRQNSQSVLN